MYRTRLFFSRRTLSFVAVLGGAVLSCSFSHAQQDERQAQRVFEDAETRRSVVIRAPGSYWLGLVNRPINSALRKHLDLADGLLVDVVIPGSPAEKAGVGKDDILLRFGDREVASLDDLLQAVEKRKDQPTELLVLRNGKEKELTITATQTPPGAIHLDRDDVVLGYGPGRWNRLRFVGPGVLAEDIEETEVDEVDEAGENVRVVIEKTGGEPAEITVQRDEQSWEVREDELDKLPAEIRRHVERILHRDRVEDRIRGQLRLRGFLPHIPNPPEVPRFRVPPPASPPPGGSQVEPPRRRRAEGPPGAPADALEDIRRELEALRAEIEKLRSDRND